MVVIVLWMAEHRHRPRRHRDRPTPGPRRDRAVNLMRPARVVSYELERTLLPPGALRSVGLARMSERDRSPKSSPSCYQPFPRRSRDRLHDHRASERQLRALAGWHHPCWFHGRTWLAAEKPMISSSLRKAPQDRRRAARHSAAPRRIPGWSTCSKYSGAIQSPPPW